MIMMMNLQAAWIGLLLGCVAGAIPGLSFYGSDWLGGYASWQRRLTRLAHISFFGIGFINLAFALTARALGLEAGLRAASILLVVKLFGDEFTNWRRNRFKHTVRVHSHGKGTKP